jgi:trehalose 2-sulfotransferase
MAYREGEDIDTKFAEVGSILFVNQQRRFCMYPRSSYVIYATQRSGSYLLCEGLRRTKVAGNPSEYLTGSIVHNFVRQWGIPSYNGNIDQIEDYLQHMYATATPNGMFGIKLIWYLLPSSLEPIGLLKGNEHLSPSELLQVAFPQHRPIIITRRDKVRQAISLWKAMQTDKWVKRRDMPDEGTPQELVFDFEEIELRRKILVASDQGMELYFLAWGIDPFKVVYEDFVNAYEETTLQILDYLQIPAPRDLVLDEPWLQKQADELTEEWVQRYYQTKQEQETIVKA